MSVVAIGNFDGVHEGHALILKNAVRLAEESGTKSIVLTFKEHPRNVLSETNKIKYLIDNEYKEQLIKSLGIDEVHFIVFDKAFASQTSAEFIGFLKNTYNCQTVICGRNFLYGKKASYTTEDLKEETEKQGIKAVIIDMVIDGIIVSSTEIRSLIENGDVKTANKLLGHFFSVSSEIVHGRRLGSTIGFPTINQLIPESFIIPKIGVYATYVEIDGKLYKGVTNVGHRPTVELSQSKVNIETHIINNNSNYYGKVIRIFFIERIRDEKKFDSLNLLKEQLAFDCEYIKKIF